jgi:hypothetical protein
MNAYASAGHRIFSGTARPWVIQQDRKAVLLLFRYSIVPPPKHNVCSLIVFHLPRAKTIFQTDLHDTTDPDELDQLFSR